MTRMIRHIPLVALRLALLSLGLSSGAYAQLGNFCPGVGPCAFTDVTLVNVYWDVSRASWDADVGGPGSGRTQAQIDAFTAALVHSTYFGQLTQYGLKSIQVAPSVTTGSCGSVPTNVDDGIARIEDVILCAMTHSPVTASPQVIINIFLPPRVINTGFCNPDASGLFNAAFHGHSNTWASPLYTFIPTTAACNAGARSTFISLSHEIVEAVTDPDPQALSGWKVPLDGENADLCPSSAFSVTSYVNGFAQQYWSNSAGGCVSGFSPSFTPSVTSTSVCGAGQNMRFTLYGNFGPTPWDLATNSFNGQSLYLTARITRPATPAWGAGNFLGLPPTVGFQRITWTERTTPGGSDRIEVVGFNGAYGAPAFNARPGDSVTFTITNPANGATTTTSMPVPFPTAISLGVAPDVLPDSTGTLNVSATDSNACGFQYASVTLSATSGAVIPTLTMGPGGDRSIGFRYPPVAGPVTFTAQTSGPGGTTITASATTNVRPRLDGYHLSEGVGPVGGGQGIALEGLGFDATTTVSFGGTLVPVVSVLFPPTKVVFLRTPPATPIGTAGIVNVTATVHGLTTGPIQYEYVQPHFPVMTFLGGVGSPGAKHACEQGRIRVTAYDATGSRESTSIALTAGYAAFLSGTQAVQKLTVSSGNELTLIGGGPITATNQNVSGAVTTQSFPILDAALCVAVKTITAKVNHLFPKKAEVWLPLKAQMPVAGTATRADAVVWADSPDVTRARNAVWMQGADTTALANAFSVVALDETVQMELAAKYPLLVSRSGPFTSADFVGPMIEIRRRVESQTNNRLDAPSHISFAAPSVSGPGSFAIVRASAGKEPFGWIEARPTTVSRDGSTLTTQADESGIYGLVRLGKSTATRPVKALQPRGAQSPEKTATKR